MKSDVFSLREEEFKAVPAGAEQPDPGERAAGFLRGRITDRYFFAGRHAASEGMNDGGLPCPHATLVGSVFPCGEMKESVCNRA